jgi:hypothetical protein
LENVNKGGHTTNKHAELWAKNKFDEWKKFHNYDTKKSIVHLSKTEETISRLVDMLAPFVLQVAKKDCSMYLPTM